jgi:hypothetical protein
MGNENANLSSMDALAADRRQWREWLALTPAERLEESSRIWVETYDVRRQAKANLGMAVKRCFGGPGKA